MIEPEAQGRLPGIAPVSVVDIGSNSIRLVVYEGLSRTPAVLFNEKVLCGLGKGLASSGLMNPEGVERAIVALRRFKALSVQARSRTVNIIATAAAREALNGPEFIRKVQAIFECPVHVLSGEEEAQYSALGIIAGFHEPDGIAGDLGGGSLELIDIRGRNYSTGITLPLGGLRLADMSGNSLKKAREIARKHVTSHPWLSAGKGRAFYAVGGTWRALGKLHMELNGYPLHLMQGYELDLAEVERLLARVEKASDNDDVLLQTVSKNRRTLLPYGAVALSEALKVIQPRSVVFSVLGVREGYQFAQLERREQLKDPLLTAAEEFAILRSRSPEHAREMAAWTGRAMGWFGVEETVEESRYRQAACLLADVSWRSHPDYRGENAFTVISQSSLTGISHEGRAFIALANYYRYEGLKDNKHSSDFASILSPRMLERAKLLGGLMRVVYLFSASMPGVVDRIEIEKPLTPETNLDLEFVIPRDFEDFLGARLDGRLTQLAKLTGMKMGFRIRD